MKNSDGGKGSSPRPYSVSQDEYAKRWDMIFSRDLDEEEQEPELEEDPDGDALRCPRCGGVDTMNRTPNAMHMVCDQCGYAERVLASEEDY
jgi:DNA-directed RNA polymerase subunit RPC12/RpoP